MLSQEDRLYDRFGVEVEVMDFDGKALPQHQGCVLAWHEADGPKFRLAIKPTVTDAQRESLSEWAFGLFDRFRASGPDVDGWQATSWGGWQLWARESLMPEV